MCVNNNNNPSRKHVLDLARTDYLSMQFNTINLINRDISGNIYFMKNNRSHVARCK